MLNGGVGLDIAIYKSTRDAYQIEKRRRNIIVTALATDEGTDTLVSIESLQFADQIVETSTLRN